MSMKVRTWSLSLAALSCLLPYATRAEEPIPAKSPEYLWEISKNHLKDPLGWPSIWRLTPQAGDPGNMQGFGIVHKDTEDPAPKAKPSTGAKAQTDWKTSEEKRTRNYLAKVGPLQPSLYEPMPPEHADAQLTPAVPGAPIKHYLSQAVVLTTPFLAESGEGGGAFARECKLRYSSSNESEILQLFDEVVVGAGQNQGVKAGDLFRTFEVGASYRSFNSGLSLGRLVETNGIVEVLRVGPKSSVARLIKCFGTISRDARACPLEGPPEVVATGYTPVTDGKLSAQVVWVTQQQQFPQPFTYAIVDRGSARGYKIGDMVLFFNRAEGKMTDKVLGDGLVISVHEKSATILIKDLYPGIINRGDYTIIVQTATAMM